MGLLELIGKYSSAKKTADETRVGQDPALPANIADWPDEWKDTFYSNVETMIDAFDMEMPEAGDVAELGTRWEYVRQQSSIDPEGADE